MGVRVGAAVAGVTRLQLERDSPVFGTWQHALRVGCPLCGEARGGQCEEPARALPIRALLWVGSVTQLPGIGAAARQARNHSGGAGPHAQGSAVLGAALKARSRVTSFVRGTAPGWARCPPRGRAEAWASLYGQQWGLRPGGGFGFLVAELPPQ